MSEKHPYKLSPLHIDYLTNLSRNFNPDEDYIKGLYERLKEAEEKAKKQEEMNNDEDFLNRKYSI